MPKLITDISRCARCGGNHPRLEFRPFVKHPVEDHGTAWNYWATCPDTGEPVLLRVEKEVESPALSICACEQRPA